MDLEKKPKKIWQVLLKILGILVLFEFITQILGAIGAGVIWEMLFYGKYTNYLISEGVVCLFALIILIGERKWHIFKERKLDFSTSVKLGMPILVISLFMLLANINVITAENFKLANFLSLAIYATFVGIFEEVFFRGIIERNLVENYHDTKKQVVFGIVISALVFSLVHIGNLFFGQELLTTIMQVMQTFAIGILFGTVYYLSKNIWSVIFLHGFYDFAVMLSDVNLIKDCAYASNVPFSITFQSLVISLFLSAIYVIYSFYVLNKKENEKPKEGYLKSIWALVIAIFAFNIGYGMLVNVDMDKYYICYNYEEKKLENIETHYYSYDDYTVKLNNKNNEEFIFKIYKKDDKAIVENVKTHEKIDLGIKDVYRVVVVQEKIMIITRDTAEYTLYYTTALNKDNVNNSMEYLNKIKNSFIEYKVPDIMAVGYLKDAKSNKIYPMVKSRINDLFIIDDKLYLVVND